MRNIIFLSLTYLGCYLDLHHPPQKWVNITVKHRIHLQICFFTDKLTKCVI